MKVSVILSVLMFAGCAHQTSINVSPAFDVYQSYEDKIPGNWSLVVNAGDLKNEVVKFNDSGCFSHTFALDLESSFSQSTLKTLANVFENIQLEPSAISRAQIASRGYKGQIIVRGEDLDTDLRSIVHFLSVDVDAEVDVSASITIDGLSGRVFGTSVSEDGEFKADLGSFCEGGSEALGKAAENAIKNTLTSLAESVANSQRLRDYATDVRTLNF